MFNFSGFGDCVKILVGLLNLVGRIGEKWHEMGEASGWDLYVPLFHPIVGVFEQHRAFLDIFMSMIGICAMCVIGQNSAHKLCNSHMQKLANFLDHDLTIDFICRLVELELAFSFLSI